MDPCVWYWFFSPCFTYSSSRLSGTSWENLKVTLSWCTHEQSCFRYQMLISQINFSEETLNQIFLCCSLLLICSPMVAVLKGNRIQKPCVKLQVTIHFLLTDDTEWCIACSFTWFIKNTQRTQQTLREDKKKTIWNLLNGLFFLCYLHNWLFASKWWINQNLCSKHNKV